MTLDETTAATIAIFGHDIRPLEAATLSARLDVGGKQSPTGKAPMLSRTAIGEHFTVRAAAVSGFAAPGPSALVSVRVSFAGGGLSTVDLRDDKELPPSAGQVAVVAVRGLADARRLARALRAAADTIDALARDIAEGNTPVAAAPVAPALAPIPPEVLAEALEQPVTFPSKPVVPAVPAKRGRGRPRKQR